MVNPLFRIVVVAGALSLAGCSGGEGFSGIAQKSAGKDRGNGDNGASDDVSIVTANKPANVAGAYLTCDWQAVEADARVTFSCAMLTANGATFTLPPGGSIRWEVPPADERGVIDVVPDALGGASASITAPSSRILNLVVNVTVAGASPEPITRGLQVALPKLDAGGALAQCLATETRPGVCFSAASISIDDRSTPAEDISTPANVSIAGDTIAEPLISAPYGVKVTLSRVLATDVSIELAIRSADANPAVSGVDFEVSKSLNVTIPAGQLFAALELTIFARAGHQDDRSFVVEMNRATSAELTKAKSATFTIRDVPVAPPAQVLGLAALGDGWKIESRAITRDVGEAPVVSSFGITEIVVNFSVPVDASVETFSVKGIRKNYNVLGFSTGNLGKSATVDPRQGDRRGSSHDPCPEVARRSPCGRR